MKLYRFALVALLAAPVVSLRAQTISNVIIQWQQNMVQTSNSAPTTDTTAPYVFKADINGNGITANSPITSASVTLPDGTTSYGLTYSSNNGGWNYKSPSSSDLTSLTTAYPVNGTAYTLTTSSGTVTFPTISSLTNDLNVGQAMTVSGATVSGGGLYVSDLTQAVTLTFNDITANSTSSSAYHYDVGLNGMTNGSVTNLSGFLNSDPTGGTSPTLGVFTVPNFTIPANALISGQTYTLQLNYAQVLGYNTTAAFGASAFAAGIYQIQTSITITTPSAVPEPATWGLLMGAAALAGAFILRRRQPRRA